MKEVIIATENRGKFQEIKSLLGDIFETLYSLNDFPEKVFVDEDSPVYVANALKKARKVGDRFGMATLADDSGLEVEALQNRPGVYSSRYGKNDDERQTRLLSELKATPFERRKAVFKSYVVFYMPERERCYVFYGDLKGYIGFERHGTGGFGFDPVFYLPERNKYLAELSLEEKNALSHRGKALLALRNFLNTDFFRGSRGFSI
ncbi:MAG TPA: RdgB/HAM1 family non-canonical purine NTP pyrophosphatase [Syntrophorhabdaceae bacterium]|nr:RdgB/HAM1 family non-canonical purine NTP pyrophosphatase [Syntrophorhabdaceae bacterium]